MAIIVKENKKGKIILDLNGEEIIFETDKVKSMDRIFNSKVINKVTNGIFTRK